MSMRPCQALLPHHLKLVGILALQRIAAAAQSQSNTQATHAPMPKRCRRTTERCTVSSLRVLSRLSLRSDARSARARRARLSFCATPATACRARGEAGEAQTRAALCVKGHEQGARTSKRVCTAAWARHAGQPGTPHRALLLVYLVGDDVRLGNEGWQAGPSMLVQWWLEVRQMQARRPRQAPTCCRLVHCAAAASAEASACCSPSLAVTSSACKARRPTLPHLWPAGCGRGGARQPRGRSRP